MPISLTLIHIAGAVCLLLWGTRMVKLGFTRAYGTSLRKLISQGTSNRFTSCASGVGVTALLQSSTAATILLLSFIKKHAITPAAAIAFIIGADIATTLVAQVLVFDFSAAAPALLTLGIIGHLKFEKAGRRRHVSRIFIGLGLMLLSLTLIRSASMPLSTSETLPLILAPLEFDPIMAVLIAAGLTWILHSSLAAILLFASFAATGILETDLAILLVFGANLGGAIILISTTYHEGLAARRVTLANLTMRLSIIIAALITFPYVLEALETFEPDPVRQITHAHTGFNVVLAIVFLPLTGLLGKLFTRILPEPKNEEPPIHAPIYLDDKAIDTPVVALAGAARETLRMAEMVQDMLENTIECFKQNTDSMAKKIKDEDDTVDKLYKEIKLYLARLTREALDPKEADRYLQILTFATNLEHIGDIIDKSLMDLAKKKIKKGERFSEEGWQEIKDFHELVVENMKLSQTIFLSEDPVLAQQLVDNKRVVREAEATSSALHFARLSDGLKETIATSALHLDIIRDYRRINSYITVVAYTILENAKEHAKERR